MPFIVDGVESAVRGDDERLSVIVKHLYALGGEGLLYQAAGAWSEAFLYLTGIDEVLAAGQASEAELGLLVAAENGDVIDRPESEIPLGTLTAVRFLVAHANKDDELRFTHFCTLTDASDGLVFLATILQMVGDAGRSKIVRRFHDAVASAGIDIDNAPDDATASERADALVAALLAAPTSQLNVLLDELERRPWS